MNKKGCKVETTEAFPCPACRPAEYAVVAGVELRDQGRYAEAVGAAMKILDFWSVGDTLIAWGVNARTAQAALREAGIRMTMTDLNELRKVALAFPPDKRKPDYGWNAHCIGGTPDGMEGILAAP